MASSASSSASGVRYRTRRAILSAAARVLVRDRAATLGDIAEAAGVGRSTLHRYFSDREELIRAAREDSLDALAESVADAAIDQGSPVEAMRRLVAAMIDVGDRLLFLFGDPKLFEEAYLRWKRDDADCLEQPVIDLIERGQAEGVFDPGVSPYWVLNVLYALAYTGVEVADQRILPRHGVVSTVVRTLENGVVVRGAGEQAHAPTRKGDI